MGTIADPFSGLIQGVLQGHAIADHLRNQAMQQEAFERSKQRDAEESQIRSLTLQQQLDNMGRRVVPGTNAVPESFNAPTTGAFPGITDTSQTVGGLRPVDKSRVLTFKDPASGQTMQWERYTPEEQLQMALNVKRQEAEVTGKAAAATEIYKQKALEDWRDTQLAKEGVEVPDAVEAGLLPAGTKVLPKEAAQLQEQARNIRTPKIRQGPQGVFQVEQPLPTPIPARSPASPFGTGAPMVGQVGPDASQANLPAPVLPGIGGAPDQAAPPNPIAAIRDQRQQNVQQFVDNAKNAGQPGTAAPSRAKITLIQGPKQTPEEDYADAFAKTLKGPDGTSLTSRTQMSKPQWDAVLGQYKAANADPEARAALISARQSAEASRTLSNTLRQIQIDQAPTKEQASQLADDLVHHNLAPDQISQIRGRGNGSLGLMVYSAAKKLDPTFNWEQASSEYQLSKSPAFQQTVRYMDSVQESIPQIIDRANKLNNFGVKGIAAAINAGKNQVNNIDLKKFQTDATLVSDEIAKILSGGGTGSSTSDAKLKQAGAILGQNDSPAAIAAALGEVKDLIGFRRKALTRGTYLENANPAAMPDAGGGADYLRTADGPGGHKIGQKADGAWYDITSGKKI